MPQFHNPLFFLWWNKKMVRMNLCRIGVSITLQFYIFPIPTFFILIKHALSGYAHGGLWACRLCRLVKHDFDFVGLLLWRMSAR
jgi:hypothetical protein